MEPPTKYALLETLCVVILIHGGLGTTTTNINLDKCEVTVYNGINYTDTSFGPFECNDYSESNGDFDNDNIESITFTNYDNFTCFAYLYSDSDFGGGVLLLNGTGSNKSNPEYSFTHYYNNLNKYSWQNSIGSLSIRYQSNFCKVSFYTSDHQISQTGSTLGIGGTYTSYMLSAHGIQDNSVTSVSITGDDSCSVYFYSDDSCTDTDGPMTIVNGTGKYNLAELQNMGFINDEMSCVIISAKTGLKSLVYHENKATISNKTLVVGNSQVVINNADDTISTTIALDSSETTSWSFSDTFEFKYTIKDSVSVSIPILDILTIGASLTISYSFDFSWTTTYSGTQTTEFDFSSTISVPSYTKVICAIYYYKADLAVPYTAIFQEIDEFGLYYTTTVNGTFKTTSLYADYVECNDLVTTMPPSKESTMTAESTLVAKGTDWNDSVLWMNNSESGGSNGGGTGKNDDKSENNDDAWWISLLVIGIVCILVAVGVKIYRMAIRHRKNSITNGYSANTGYEQI